MSNLFKQYWKEKYEIFWCNTCDCYSILCPAHSCNGTSCNGGGCDKCSEDTDEFNKLKSHITDYLNEDERKAYQKAMHVKRLIEKMLERGDTFIDFKKFKREGLLCPSDEIVFADEL